MNFIALFIQGKFKILIAKMNTMSIDYIVEITPKNGEKVVSGGKLKEVMELINKTYKDPDYTIVLYATEGKKRAEISHTYFDEPPEQLERIALEALKFRPEY